MVKNTYRNQPSWSDNQSKSEETHTIAQRAIHQRDPRGERGRHAAEEREAVPKLHGFEGNLHHQEPHQGRQPKDGDHAEGQGSGSRGARQGWGFGDREGQGGLALSHRNTQSFTRLYTETSPRVLANTRIV